MRKKLAIFLICILLISNTTSLALTSFNKDTKQIKKSFFDTIPCLLPAYKGWNKTFGGIYEDFGNSVRQTSDGGYIITGGTDSNGTGIYDVTLIKIDSNGNKVWNRTFAETDFGVGNSVQQTTDGGYIITGFTFSQSANTLNIWLIKIDTNGNKVWERTFGGRIDFGVGYSVQQTIDGGYIITGDKAFGGGISDVWLIKTNNNGIEEWNRTFGGTEIDYGESVQQTTDGGYIITGLTGFSYNTGCGDFWLIKTNSYGIEEWNRTFGGTNVDWSCSVQQTSDEGYIITGWTTSFGTGNEDVWLIKTDNVGNKVWDRTFGGVSFDSGNSVQQTIDGGYIITGETYSYGVGGDVWLIKTDSQGKSRNISSGNLLFEKLVKSFPIFEKILNQLL